MCVLELEVDILQAERKKLITSGRGQHGVTEDNFMSVTKAFDSIDQAKGIKPDLFDLWSII